MAVVLEKREKKVQSSVFEVLEGLTRVAGTDGKLQVL